MASFNKFNSFVEALAEKVHNLGYDTLKVMLTITPPSAANTQKSDITELTPGNGYVAGGQTVTITSSAQSSGSYKLVGNDVTFTASGGSMGPFRYIVLYNDTATNKELIGYWDNGSSVTLASGESYPIDFSSSNGILQIV